MSVLYYCAKKTFIDRNFILHGIQYFYIDGRYYGEPVRIYSKGNYRTIIHSLAFLLSLRLLAINKDYLDLCSDDSLIFISKPKDTFEWMNYMTLIINNWDDEEVKKIYHMMEDFYYDNKLLEEKKDDFVNSLIVPDYKKEREFYGYLAQRTKGVSENIIGNNAFVEADIDKYIVSKDIVYIGNTAFAYCEKLAILEIKGKPMFGVFPIIECTNLKQIIVPDGLKDYFAGCLPYYKDIIVEEKCLVEETETNDYVVEEDLHVSTDDNEIKNENSEISTLESDVEIPKQESTPVIEREEEKETIDFKILNTVFDKKASSYKYFWMLAIISLAKENNRLSLTFDEITIRMAALAWPIVFDDDIDLGATDMLKKYLEIVVKKTTLIHAASSRVVENYLKQHFSSQGIDSTLAPLMKNVPYRFLSPWIKYTTDDEVIKKSCSKHFTGPYAIHSDNIVFDEDWWEYIESNYTKICDFVLQSFYEYAKKYNNPIKLIRLMTNGFPLVGKDEKNIIKQNTYYEMENKCHRITGTGE